jgi:hypothetical protein
VSESFTGQDIAVALGGLVSAWIGGQTTVPLSHAWSGVVWP